MKKLVLFLLILSTTSAVIAQTLPIKLKDSFNKFCSDQQLKYATVTFTVLNASNGELIFGGNPNFGVAPASSFKTVTSATALALLGEDYTYKTNIYYTGKVENGVLNGDLIISGSGDPTLGSSRWKNTSKNTVLSEILSALQKAGINTINGNIIADDSTWDTQSLPNGWIWQDIGNYYGAGTSALTWGENQFELDFSPGKTIGSSVRITRPNIYPFLEFKNELTTGILGSGDNVYAYSAPYTSLVYLRGSYGIDLNKKIGISLPDPALAMAFDVTQFLKNNGLKCDNYTTSRILGNQASASKNLLKTLISPPLKEIIYWFNQKSINLYGEQLLRTLAANFGKNTSTLEGIKVLKKFWEDKGIAPETLNIYDGSGLSPANKVTSSSIAKALLYAKKQAWYPSYLESLPIHNDMKMKSGTINDVLAYAGYSVVDGKVPVCFSIVINNYTGSSSTVRQKMFNLLNQLK
ncbi:D-alanyl-D-alanine carboxypeptidase/D-alanyl-D-alanine-endopeptidase [Pelobium sp.]|nr:D-alanyl-D-alanine carboxypeptidase/D-alanyl-D-alanine-endopeptidase [Pelobium sp.]MDA9555822.1 D-alanyl-D-alanine carboxypeptidase/D-alanyl-D-alanine-endopeptidase [Pelobium sp.]